MVPLGRLVAHNGSVPTDDPTPVRRARHRPPAPALAGLAVLVALLVAAGWVVWEYAGTGVVARHTFAQETQQLRQRWQTAPPGAANQDSATAPAGEAVALLRVPAWGDAAYPIVQGVSADDLRHGVGLYPGSVAPGGIGNLTIAGNRVTYGAPFYRLGELNKGDRILIETGTTIYTYVLDNAPRDLTVTQHASWVLDPVPGEPHQQPDRALLTLTTAQDLFRSPDRTVAFGHLISTVAK